MLTKVTALRRYLAEEIGHVDGLLTRRETTRRVALFGVGAAAAGELVSACADRQSPPGPADAWRRLPDRFGRYLT